MFMANVLVEIRREGEGGFVLGWLGSDFWRAVGG